MVQPNFEILVPVDQLSFQETGLLEKFAERTSADLLSIYCLNQNTLYRAAQDGILLNDILGFLGKESATGIPGNVRQSTEDWWTNFFRIRVMRKALVLEENGSFSLLEKDGPELPSVDYRNLPQGFDSWKSG